MNRPNLALVPQVVGAIVDPNCPPSFPANRPLETVGNITNLGRTVSVVVNDGKLTEILNLKARCSLGEMLAVVIGVDCLPGCPAPRTDGRVQGDLLPRIYLSWSLGGATFRAAMDARHGMVVTVPADSVWVQATVLGYSPPGVEAENTILPYCVSISAGVAYGAGSLREAARLTVPVYAAAGEIVNIPVPPFASGFALVPLEGQTLSVEAITNGSAGPWATYEATAPSESFSGFPLFNGASCLRIDNTDGTDVIQGFVVFALDL